MNVPGTPPVLRVGIWVPYEADDIKDTPIGELAAIAKRRYGAVLAQNDQARIEAENALTAWAHRHVRNRWIASEDAAGRYPASLLLAHQYRGQRSVRVSALVGIVQRNAVSGGIALVLKNLFKVSGPAETIDLHPSFRDGTKTDFPSTVTKAGGLDGEEGDPVIAVSLLDLGLQHWWSRDGESGPGTGPLGSDRLQLIVTREPPAGQYAIIMGRFYLARVGAVVGKHRKGFDRIYPRTDRPTDSASQQTHEIPAAGTANVAVWADDVIMVEAAGTPLPWKMRMQDVQATSVITVWGMIQVELGRYSTIQAAETARVLDGTLASLVPAYEPPNEPGVDPRTARVIWFDPVFEWVPPPDYGLGQKHVDRYAVIKARIAHVAGEAQRVGSLMSATRAGKLWVAMQTLKAAQLVWTMEDPADAIFTAMRYYTKVIPADIVAIASSTVAIGSIWHRRVEGPFPDAVQGSRDRLVREGTPIPGVPTIRVSPLAPPTGPARPPTPPPGGPPGGPPRPSTPPPGGPPGGPARPPTPPLGGATPKAPPTAKMGPYIPAIVDLNPATSPGAIDTVYNALMRHAASGNIHSLPISPRAREMRIAMPRYDVPTSTWVRHTILVVKRMRPIQLGRFQMSQLGGNAGGDAAKQGLVVGWALPGSRAGKRIPHLGGYPTIYPTTDKRAGQVSVPSQGVIMAKVTDATGRKSKGSLGSYTVRVSAAGRAVGWIRTNTGPGTPEIVVGVLGGVRASDPAEFQLRFLLVDLDRVPGWV